MSRSGARGQTNSGGARVAPGAAGPSRTRAGDRIRWPTQRLPTCRREAVVTLWIEARSTSGHQCRAGGGCSGDWDALRPERLDERIDVARIRRRFGRPPTIGMDVPRIWRRRRLLDESRECRNASTSANRFFGINGGDKIHRMRRSPCLQHVRCSRTPPSGRHRGTRLGPMGPRRPAPSALTMPGKTGPGNRPEMERRRHRLT
jgi:hypothetical protein